MDSTDRIEVAYRIANKLQSAMLDDMDVGTNLLLLPREEIMHDMRRLIFVLIASDEFLQENIVNYQDVLSDQEQQHDQPIRP